MKADEIPVVPKDGDAKVEPGVLAHLSELHDLMIADPYPDIRGWKVVLPDGRTVGKVDDLIVDTDEMVVKYLEVKVDRDLLRTDEDTWVLVPVGAARIDEKDDVVEIDRLPKAGLAGAPRYARGVPTRQQERELREYYEPATRAAGAREGSGLFDQRRFWGKRRAGREGSPYLSRIRGRDTTPVVEEPIVPVVVKGTIIDEVVVEQRVVPGDQPGEAAPAPERRDAERRGDREAR